MRSPCDTVARISGTILAAFITCAAVAGCGGNPPATAKGQPVAPPAGGAPSAGPSDLRDRSEEVGPTVWSAKADPSPEDTRRLNSDAYPISIEREFSASFPIAARPTALLTRGGGKIMEAVAVDLRTGERSNVLHLGESIPPHVTLGPSGKLLAGKLLQSEDRVRVWSFDTGRIAADVVPPKALAPRASGISLVRFASDRRLIAIRPADRGGEAIVIPVGDPGAMRQMLIPSLVDQAVGVSPGGRYLAVLGEGRLLAYDLDLGACCGIGSFDRRVLDDRFNVGELTFSPDGREVATLVRLHDAGVRALAWDFTTGKLIENKSLTAETWRKRHPNLVQQSDEQPLAWLPDGSGWVLYGRMIWKRDDDAPGEDFPEPEDDSVRRLLDADRVVTLTIDSEGAKSLRLLARGGIEPAPAEMAGAPTPAGASDDDDDEWKATSDPALPTPTFSGKSLAAFGRPLGEPRFPKRPGAWAALPVGERYAIVDLERGVETSRISAGRLPPPTILDVSSDGRLIAVGDLPPSDGPLTIRVLNATTGAEAWSIETDAPRGERHVEFLDSSRLLISLPIADSSARRIAVHAAANATLEFRTSSEIGAYVSGSHAVSPGGRWLTFASEGRLRAFDLTTGESAGSASIPLPSRIAAINAVHSPCFSLDGSRLLWLVEDTAGYRALIWNMTTGAVASDRPIDAADLARAAGSEEDVDLTRSVPWRPDGADWLMHGQAAVAASTGQVVGPFGLNRMRAVLPLDANSFLAAEVAIGPDDEALVIHSFSSDARRVEEAAVASLADLRPRPDVPAAPPRPPVAPPVEVADPARMADAEGAKRAWAPIVDPPKDGGALTIAEEFEGPARNVDAFVVSQPAPAFVLEVDESDDVATLRDVGTGLIVGGTFEFAGDPRLAAVRIDGAYVAHGGEDADVLVQDVENGSSIAYRNDESFNYLRWLGFNGEGHVVAAFSDEDDRIHARVLRTDREEVVREFGIARDDWDVRNAGFAISPGGKWLATIRIDGLTLYDLTDPSIRREAPIPYRNDASHHPILLCEGAAFSPDGRRLAALCRRLQYSFLVIWDLATGEASTYRPYSRTLAERAPRSGEQGPALTWTPDGKSVVWGSSVLIEPTTGTPYWVVPNDDLVPIAALSADRMLAVAQDGVGHKLVAAPLPVAAMEKTRVEALAARSEAPLPLTAVDAAAYEAPSMEPAALAGPFVPDPPTGNLALAESVEVGPHGNGGRIPRFRLVASGAAIVERQIILETPVVAGPMQPERQSKLEAYDLASGDLLGAVEIPGRTRLLAVSPDGELALCGAPVGDFNFDEFGRLDLWWPKREKHVLSWRPVPIETPVGEVVTWAAFADKRHVLTFGAETLTCWELPSCRVVYRVPFGFHPPRMSPGGVRLLQPSRGLVRDSLTGAVVARLEGVGDGGKYLAINHAAPDGDGASVLGIASDGDQSYVVRWELPSGKVMEEHPVPRDVGSVSRIGEDRLLLNSMTFGDVLFSRSLGSPFARADVRGVTSTFGPDGSLWRVENARSVRLRKIAEADLPLPLAAPEILSIPRGAAMGVDVDSNLPTAATLRASLAKELERSGYRVDGGAGARAKLTMNKIDKTLRKGPPRDVVIPYVQGGIQIVANDGQVVWQAALERMWEKPEDVDPVGWIQQHEIPSLFYRPDWGARLETLKLPLLEKTE